MSDTTIDKILEDFFHPPQPPSDTVKIVYKPIDPKYYKELKSALYDLIDKWVIGGEFYGDDNYRPFLVASRTMPIEENQKQAKITLKARNQLRQEMRNKLKELFK